MSLQNANRFSEFRRGSHNQHPQASTPKKRFSASNEVPTTTTTTSKAPSGTMVTVIDPAFRAGKLNIPVELTFPTQGRDEWLSGRLRKDLSLCCLFQKGRCHVQESCHQVHADRDYVTTLREQQAKIVSCCRRCQDTYSITPAANTFFSKFFPLEVVNEVKIVYNNNSHRAIPCGQLALTTGLEMLVDEQGSASIVPVRKICRLHLSANCKYGKDCKNVHFCSKLGSDLLNEPTPQQVLTSRFHNLPPAPQTVSARKPTTPVVVVPATAPLLPQVPRLTPIQPKTPSPVEPPAMTSFPSLVPTPPTTLPNLPSSGSRSQVPTPPSDASPLPGQVPRFNSVPSPRASLESSQSSFSSARFIRKAHLGGETTDTCENSGALRGLIFDLNRLLEDSTKNSTVAPIPASSGTTSPAPYNPFSNPLIMSGVEMPVTRYTSSSNVIRRPTAAKETSPPLMQLPAYHPLSTRYLEPTAPNCQLW